MGDEDKKEEVAVTEAEEAAPAMPALDAKMPLTLVCLYFARQIDTKDPDVLAEQQLRFMYVTAGVCAVLAYSFLRVYFSSDKSKQIWVPPKKPPANPFAPAPEVKAELTEYEATTYGEHEMGLLRTAVGQAAMAFGIAMVMSYKFGIHMSVVMNQGTLPYGLWECLVSRKYLGVAGFIGAGSGGEPLYGELTEKPKGWKPPASKKED